MKLRVMTYNIASGHNYEEDRRQDLAFAQGVIEQYQPDIVGLNEVQENSRVSQYTSQTQILAKGLEMYGYFGPGVADERWAVRQCHAEQVCSVNRGNPHSRP